MIAHFALRLVFGMSLTWCVMPRGAVTAGFFRIQMLVALGLSVLAALTCPQIDAVAAGETLLGLAACRVLCIVMAVTAFVGSVLWTLVRRSAGTVAAWVLAGLSGVAVVGVLPWGDSAAPAGMVLSVGAAASSAWLIGSLTVAMLLGHWYLTATGMPLAPLQRLNQLMGTAAVLRGVFAAWGLAALGTLEVGTLPMTWLVLRWSAGILGPLVMCGLVMRILRYRNTQSATGVLFAGVILVFIGETTAMLLTRELGFPL